ncbi:MAG: hypothetical protein RIC95_10470 [Vicingaceae bacterium]
MTRFHFYLFVLSFCFASHLQAQNSDSLASRKDFGSPSYLDLSVGLGANHAMLGTKAVVGYNGSGLLLALGTYKGFTTTSIGLQLCYKSFFVSYAKADYSYYEIESPNFYQEGILSGNVFLAGLKGSFRGKEKFFMQLGFGVANGGERKTQNGAKKDGSYVMLDFGLGYRFGSGTLSPYGAF